MRHAGDQVMRGGEFARLPQLLLRQLELRTLFVHDLAEFQRRFLRLLEQTRVFHREADMAQQR